MTILYSNSQEDGSSFDDTEIIENENGNPDVINIPGVQISTLNAIAKEFKILRQQVHSIISQLRQTKDRDTLFRVAVSQIREKIGGDRILIYQFTSSESGIVLAESRTLAWTPAQGENLPAIIFGSYTSHDYVEPVLIDDINQVQLTPYQKQLFDKFQVKASLTFPMVIDDKIWGLLVVHSCAESRQWQETEISLLSQVSTELIYKLQSFRFVIEEQQLTLARKAVGKVINKLVLLSNVDKIFETTNQEVRQLLKCDRVGVYRFNPDWSGQFVAESVGNNWVKMVTSDFQMVWEDTHLQETKGGRYAKGETFAVNDIYQAGHTQCHVDILEQFQMMAYIIAPIFLGEQLWGLLAAYQNSSQRQWQPWEINFVTQVGSQFGIAVTQGEFLEKVQKQSEQLSQIAEQEKALTKIVNRIRQSSDLDHIFKTTTQDVRFALKCDRVAVYQFKSDWGGEFIAESVGQNWVKLVGNDLKTVVDDTYLQETQGGRCAKGETIAVSNIYQANITPCYIEILEQFEAKAYMMVPIFFADKLWGLLAAYQNSDTREWQPWEVNFLTQISLQFNLAQSQIEYLEQTAGKIGKTSGDCRTRKSCY